MANDPPLQLDHTENEPYNCDVDSLVPLDAVEWRPEFKEALEKLVLTVHCLVVHTYQLAQWTFVFEPLQTPDFNHGRFMDQMYFYYVFMALAEYKSPDKRKKAEDERKTGKGKRKHGKGRIEKAITYKFKELLAKHIAAYCTVAVNTDMDVDGAGVNEVGKAKDAADTAKNVDAAKKVGNTKEAARGKGRKSADDKTSRKFNQNMAAVLNFRRILVSLRETGDIPENFKCGTPKDTVAKNGPRDSGAVTVGSASTAKKKSMRKQLPSKRLKKA
ncbi:hypothetical protein GGI16_003799 [Coemansia sp. S142-1]|nr:hypothetical protein GGI16_003799 [Coemansia sp. S142-1]